MSAIVTYYLQCQIQNTDITDPKCITLHSDSIVVVHSKQPKTN